jgi:hypothetical protein
MLAVKKEIKILVKTKQAGNSNNFFRNLRRLLTRQKSQDFCRIDKSLTTSSYLFTYLENVLCSLNRPHLKQL